MQSKSERAGRGAAGAEGLVVYASCGHSSQVASQDAVAFECTRIYIVLVCVSHSTHQKKECIIVATCKRTLSVRQVRYTGKTKVVQNGMNGR